MTPESESRNEIRLIIARNLPCWYELSWNRNNTALVLRIHKDFINRVQPPTSDSPDVLHHTQKLGVGKFSDNFGDDIGFDGVFKKQEKSGEFVEFALAFPGCNQETGKKIEWDWLYNASASLSIYSSLLEWRNEKDTPSKLTQLLTVETTTSREMYGGSLRAQVSIPLRGWLSRRPGTNTLPEARMAMMQAYNRITGGNSSKSYFETLVWENGGLNLHCPGNGCCLNPSGYIREGRGYNLTPHNVDNPVQQLTLIAGLAAIYDKAREEIGLLK